ncbi:MAG: alkaline phosphatase family protein [Candidatus Competibacteraceae bacterium]|nr:alkaline phosphatase family protein [Candidatus Competibacteraceae bacterium]
MRALASFFIVFVIIGGISCHYQTEFCNRPFLEDLPPTVTKIGIGSCGSENESQPILNTMASKNLDLFIYLGDNVYCDTDNMDEMRSEYRKLSCKSEFVNLITSTYTIAVWDDHDYGENDAGASYPYKEESKQIFLEFWNEPDTSSRYQHAGIYHALYFGDLTHRVQIILLDCRSFRSLQIEENGNYIPDESYSASMLGDAQWMWLEEELQKPAQIRIVCSSTQFATQHNGWETWDNYPNEMNMMREVIQSTGAEHLIFVSGDVHYAELSKRNYTGLYPIYDFTASGITNIEHNDRPNVYRIGEPVKEPHAGMITIDWGAQTIMFEVINVAGNSVFSYVVPWSELEF